MFASAAAMTRAEAKPTSCEEFGGMIGKSAELLAVCARIERIAPVYRTALIIGKTGTGKELAARALHEHSPVSHGNFVTLNCSAVVETLFESELFGHIKGSFTDARRDKVGLFEHAHNGTLFLDEVGDMPLTTQAKLLRALQNQEVLPVGAVTPHRVDVRVIAATNKDLRAAVGTREFREDLYYRLSMIEIEMPCLRQRQGDVPLLAKRFAQRWCDTFDRPFQSLSSDAMRILTRYPWPGNVRELDNVIGHACMLSLTGEITVDDLPEYLHHDPVSSFVPDAPKLPLPEVLSPHVADVLEEYEFRLVQQALAATGQNQARAARILRTSRDRLRYKMKKYGLLQAAADGPQLCA